MKILDDDEFLIRLEEKLDEEVAEYHQSGEADELADILEVICALCEARGGTVDELTALYRKKHAARGGFSRKILLIGKK